MQRKLCLEICVDSYSSAAAAVKGGADRLELCSCLMAGGLTPDTALLEQIREESDISVRCLMRPRYGDFLYDEAETEMMEKQIKRLSAAGADGFVIGCLNPGGNLDMDKMQRLIDAADGKGITLHRAIDVSRDGIKTAHEAAELGIDTILTSGREASCWEGREFIGKLLDEELPLTIMPGAGVNADIIRKMKKIMPISCFHMSGKVSIDSGMRYRHGGVPMGIPGLDEYSIWQTDEKAVRAAAEALREYAE